MQDPEIISSSSPRLTGAPPDTLYMLRNQTMPLTKIDIENAIYYDTSKLPGMIQGLFHIIEFLKASFPHNPFR